MRQNRWDNVADIHRIEHSKNKIIGNFESEVGPGVLQFSIQEAFPCKNSRQQGQNRSMVSSLRFVA